MNFSMQKKIWRSSRNFWIDAFEQDWSSETSNFLKTKLECPNLKFLNLPTFREIKIGQQEIDEHWGNQISYVERNESKSLPFSRFFLFYTFSPSTLRNENCFMLEQNISIANDTGRLTLDRTSKHFAIRSGRFYSYDF